MSGDTDSALPRFFAAQALAREAGALMRARFLDRGSFTLAFKGHQDYLTEVDGEIERLVVGRLREAFPQDGFIAEEGGGHGAAGSASLWVIDPIDGTANFAGGIPHFCISIAYLRDGRPEIGVVHDPVRNELFAAMRGKGALLDGRRLAVSGLADPRAATVEVGWNMRSGMADFVRVVEAVTALGAGIVRSGSGALGIAYVAAGRLDAYCETHINAWDVLAGLLLVTEAGGYASDFLSGHGLLRGNPILVATPELRDALVGATGIGSRSAT